ncbi:MAG: patatin-like phospholipase family protein [Candidatus Gracilibacteria bacterium]|nr:patatin-like phospholipase family protein [Candidatus Gracilibacteria bacterium]
MDFSNKKIGLALGGGSARGCAHIGVIRALEKAGVPIHLISGTSIGSLVGGIYAGGNLDELENIAKGITWNKIVPYLDIRIQRQALLKGQKATDLIDKLTPIKQIEDLQIPFCAVATDVENGDEITFKKGPLLDAIRASISLPAIFTPPKINNRYLVDGGLVNPLPINVLRDMGADIVIAVDLNHHFSSKDSGNSKQTFPDKIKNWLSGDDPSIIDILGWSVNIMQDQITRKNLMTYPADILIQPKLGHILGADFHKAQEMIDEGFRAVEEALETPTLLKGK